jgi:hypothetical protein
MRIDTEGLKKKTEEFLRNKSVIVEALEKSGEAKGKVIVEPIIYEGEVVNDLHPPLHEDEKLVQQRMRERGKIGKIYFSPAGFICGECNQLLFDEPAVNKSMKVFCVNMNCSENLVTKIVKLPEVTEYEISLE